MMSMWQIVLPTDRKYQNNQVYNSKYVHILFRKSLSINIFKRRLWLVYYSCRDCVTQIVIFFPLFSFFCYSCLDCVTYILIFVPFFSFLYYSCMTLTCLNCVTQIMIFFPFFHLCITPLSTNVSCSLVYYSCLNCRTYIMILILLLKVLKALINSNHLTQSGNSADPP